MSLCKTCFLFIVRYIMCPCLFLKCVCLFSSSSCVFCRIDVVSHVQFFVFIYQRNKLRLCLLLHFPTPFHLPLQIQFIFFLTSSSFEFVCLYTAILLCLFFPLNSIAYMQSNFCYYALDSLKCWDFILFVQFFKLCFLCVYIWIMCLHTFEFVWCFYSFVLIFSFGVIRKHYAIYNKKTRSC